MLNQRAVCRIPIILLTQDGLEENKCKQNDTKSSLKLYLHPIIQSVRSFGPMGLNNLQGALGVREPKSRRILRQRLYWPRSEEAPAV